MNYSIIKGFLLSLLPMSLSAQVASDKQPYDTEIRQWINNRDQTLRGFASPLSLAGMYWLQPGENSFGTDASNSIVFPEGSIAAKAGKYIVRNDSVILVLNNGTGIASKGKTAVSRFAIPQQDSLKYKSNDQSIVLEKGTLRWFLMINGGRLAIRLLDSNTEDHRLYNGVSRYPVNKDWRIPAKFESYKPNTTIAITNVLGKVDQRAAAGIVRFNYNGRSYELEALDRDGQLFFVFSDGTSNETSYQFRFLYANKPADGQITYIDFNKATNPNCAFSAHAPCPLPPEKNKLDFAIPAGEKKYTVVKRQEK